MHRRVGLSFLIVVILLVVGCGDRVTLGVSAPLTVEFLIDDLRSEISRAAPSTRRRISIEHEENAIAPLLLDGAPLRPSFPRVEAIEECLGRVGERPDAGFIVAYPANDPDRGEEAAIFADAGAKALAVENPENFSRTTDELIENGAVGGATVVLLLGDHTPLVANWLRGRMPDVEIVIEALFQSSVERLRKAGVEIGGAIVLDLAGTLDTVDNYEKGTHSVIYLPSVFYR